MIRKGVRHVTTGTAKQADNDPALDARKLDSVSELCIPVPWGRSEVKPGVLITVGRFCACMAGLTTVGHSTHYSLFCQKDFMKQSNVVLREVTQAHSITDPPPYLTVEMSVSRYVAVDLAGHGRSSHRPPGVLYTFPSYVMDVRRVVDALQWNTFSIIGHSMGGNIAGMFSALYPEMVDVMVLLDSYGFLPTDPKEMPKVLRQGLDEMIQYEKKKEDMKTRVYTYEKAVERLLVGNQSLTEESAKILLERGLVEVEGGVAFSRDFRINLKNVVRISLEQSLELQAKIEASVLVVLADDGYEKILAEADQKKCTSGLLQAYMDRCNMVVKVPGNHHVHLNNPEVVAPLVSEFLQNKAASASTGSEDVHAPKL